MCMATMSGDSISSAAPEMKHAVTAVVVAQLLVPYR